MTIVYKPTTTAVKPEDDVNVTLEDKDFMLYEMLNKLLNQLKRRPRG